MAFFANQDIEFKQEYVPEIRKEVIAFADTNEESSFQSMTDEGIREMIIRNTGRSYEACRSLRQDLTFRTLEEELDRRHIEHGKSQIKTLRLTGEDGLYTNLALLLSDQCESTTKVALFQGTDKAVFRDRQEFSGSVLRQMEEVYRLIDINNKTKAIFSGIDRTDIRDYPEEAVREVWLNCLTHRDYSFSGSTIINIYDDRMEFVSLGGLVPGLELDSIFLGVSQSGNPNLAAVLYKMRLIESYGTGIGKIRRAYAGKKRQPVFETAKGVFRVTLPNCNELRNAERELPEEQRQMILEFAAENGSVSRKEVEELIQAGTTKAFRLLRELCMEGKLKAAGSGRLIRYIPL